MSERLPELDQVESHDAAANDAQYDIPSAEVIDITSGEPYDSRNITAFHNGA
jgi:hypothetical protein